MAENMKRADFEKAGWTRESYEIHWLTSGTGGTRRVRGYTRGVWGIRRADKTDKAEYCRGWYLTHIPSGMAAWRECWLPRLVVEYADFLDGLKVDWTAIRNFNDIPMPALQQATNERDRLRCRQYPEPRP